MILTSR